MIYVYILEMIINFNDKTMYLELNLRAARKIFLIFYRMGYSVFVETKATLLKWKTVCYQITCKSILFKIISKSII